MSNEYFTHTDRLVPVTPAKAGDVNALFDAVEDGFDLLPSTADLGASANIYGTTTGTSTEYQLSASILTSLNDGQRVSIKIHSTNTGASTLEIIGGAGSLGVQNILRSNLNAVDSGVLEVNSVHTLMYNGTAWIIQDSLSGVVTECETIRDATATIYDQFDDRYLGSKSSDPTVDNDGNALLTGATYFNTSTNTTRTWSGSVWVENNQYVKTVSETPPSSPYSGQEWLDTTTGVDYTYFEDGDSGQWLQQTIKNPTPTVIADYAFTTTTITTTAGIDVLNYVNFIDATSASIVATLPTAVGKDGIVVNCKRIDSSSNTVTVDTTGAETIDGYAGATLLTNQNLQVISDGANWRIL